MQNNSIPVFAIDLLKLILSGAGNYNYLVMPSQRLSFLQLINPLKRRVKGKEGTKEGEVRKEDGKDGKGMEICNNISNIFPIAVPPDRLPL